MNDMNTKVKMKVLQDLIAMLDEKELGGLKSKSPKFMKPEMEMPMDEESSELPEEFMKEESEEKPSFEPEMESDEDDEDLEKLREIYNRIK